MEQQDQAVQQQPDEGKSVQPDAAADFKPQGVIIKNTDPDRLNMPPYRDARFYQKRKHNTFREVEAPRLPRLVADTHAHLRMFDDPAFELARCAMRGVGFMCLMNDPCEAGTEVFENLETWQADAVGCLDELRAQEGAENISPVLNGEPTLPYVRIAVGVHPHNAHLYDQTAETLLKQLLADPRVCALGEIGLDYHYDFSTPDQQRDAFRRQLRIAKEAGLPVALHVREAYDEALEILLDEGFPPSDALLHCCSLDEESLRPWVEAGCYIAYGGSLTFKKADDTRAAAHIVPRNRLLTETDAPYMTPEPMRGVACTPAHVLFNAAKLCEVLECTTESAQIELLDQLMENAHALLDRDPTPWQLAHANR